MLTKVTKHSKNKFAVKSTTLKSIDYNVAMTFILNNNNNNNNNNKLQAKKQT